MSLLPIVIRELGLASRRPATYRIRFWIALVTVVIALAMLVSRGRSTAQLGHEIFSVLSVLVFAYALLSGVRCTADSLSEEKREGTLGLLFLTTLRGYDVVVGKLVVSSLEAAYGLVSTLPILAVPVLLGAVTGSEFWRMNLLLLNTLLFSLALGLLVSTFGHQERGVLLGTLWAVLLMTFGFPLLWKGATHLADSRLLDWLFLFPSPAYAFKMVSDSTIRSASWEYWLSMLSMAVLALGAILFSSLMLPRLFQEKGRLQQNGCWRARLHRWRFGDPQFRRFLDADQIEQQPFYWLLSRDRLPGFWLGPLVVVTVLFALWAPSAFHTPNTPATPIAMFGALGLHLLCKLLVAAEASRRLHMDKRSGALELLLSTPLSVASALAGQMRSLQKRFVLPFLALAMVNWLILLEVTSRRDDFPGLLSGMLIAPLDFYALSWLGMLTGLREPRYTRAVFRTFGAVMVPPWIVIFLFVFANSHRGISSSAVHAFFFYWFLFAAVYELVLAHWAKTQLLTRFRLLAANDLRPPRLLKARLERPQPRPMLHV